MNLALGVVTTVKVSFFAMFVLVELSLTVWKKNPCNQTE